MGHLWSTVMHVRGHRTTTITFIDGNISTDVGFTQTVAIISPAFFQLIAQWRWKRLQCGGGEGERCGSTEEGCIKDETNERCYCKILEMDSSILVVWWW